MSELTPEEKATNFETYEHIHHVQTYVLRFAQFLIDRALAHDRSKLSSPEVEMFTEFTPKLRGLTYGSPEYKACTAAMGPALEHHYLCNSHHPEHHDRGVDGMNLLDLVEMFCDWKAATLRHADGNLWRSIAINATRWSLSPQLISILENSIGLVDLMGPGDVSPRDLHADEHTEGKP